jgi:hypothetical protein
MGPNVRKHFSARMLLASLLAGSIAAAAAMAAPLQEKSESEIPAVPHAAGNEAPALPLARSDQARIFYRSVWGIDRIQVREAASGALIRFSYRVTDARKAQALNDRKSTPYLIDERTGVTLQVPAMEKIGSLRQTAAPENGREYWMVFSNKGHYVGRGSRIDIQIGGCRIDGMQVD